jgi:hypothetical protein
LATATFAIAMIEEGYTKLILIYVLEEKSPPGAAPYASFIYLDSEKYKGEIQYKVVNPDITLLWILPSSLVSLKNGLDYLVALPYVFTWLAVATLLRQYYKSLKRGKFPVAFWIVLAIPLALYLIGSGLIISLPADIPFRFYFRLIFRGRYDSKQPSIWFSILCSNKKRNIGKSEGLSYYICNGYNSNWNCK